MTTPLWVANTRLKLQGTKLKTGASSHGGCSPWTQHTNYSGLIGMLPVNETWLPYLQFINVKC